MNIIPFENHKVPAVASELSRKYLAINSDVATFANHPTISIKGKVFSIVKDGQRKQLTKTDDDGEIIPVASISISVLRANLKARVYYADAYEEDSAAGARPTCHSLDGIAPANDSEVKQAAKCQLCPHAVWGSKTGDMESGKGTACSPNARLAVAAPDKPSEPMLLRVPPASIKAFRDAVKLGEARQLPYNQLVMRIGFDREAASPKLTFKPVGVLDDGHYQTVADMYENEVVQQIVGVAAQAAAALPAPETEGEASELDAAIKAKATVKKAATTASSISLGDIANAVDVAASVTAETASETKPKATKTKPVAEAKPEPEVKAAPKAETVVSDSSNLLGDLESLLGGMDD